MGVQVGDCIEVKTRTLEDAFGTCVYKIVGPTVEKEEQGCTKQLTKCIMLESSRQPNASGMEIWDELSVIDNNIEEGITRILSPEEAERFAEEQ